MSSEPPLVGLSLSPTWLRGNAWRRADSRVEELHTGDFHVAAAVAAEQAGVDFVFKPDVPTLDPATISRWPGFSSVDPTLLMAVLARETERIGLVTTISTTLAPAHLIARQVQSLHQLSGGRAGWNVVMSLAGHEAVGLDEMPRSEERYDRAAEVIDVVRRLWASYPSDALRVDRATGVYADPGDFRPVDHRGRHLRVAATSTVPEHDEPVPLFQAGGSPAGVAFAGATADAVFAMTATVEEAAAQRRALRRAAEAAGRSADAVRCLPGFSFCLASTRAEAELLAEDQMLPPVGPGAQHWNVVGTPDDAVGAVEQWLGAGAIDGIIALPCGSWGSLDLFLREVVPALRCDGDRRSHSFAARLGLRRGG